MIKTIIIILLLFTYIYPVFLKFSPIPTDRIIQVIGFIVMFFSSRFFIDILKIKGLKSILDYIFLMVVFIFIIYIWNFGNSDLYFLKETSSILFYFFSACLVCYVLSRKYSNNLFVRLLDYIVIISVIQAVISLLIFVNPDLFNMYLDLLNPNTNQGLFDRVSLIERRLIGVGSAFFSGAIKYGVVFFILIILPYCKDSFIGKNKLFYILSFTIISVAGMLTARTFFGAVFLGLVLYILIDLKNGLKLVFKILPLLLIISIIITKAFDFFIEGNRLEEISGFVFEIFFNYLENGELVTSSSDATLSMYIFPDSLKTWLFGDGRMLLANGYYMRTDIGYIRLLFYFGIVGMFFYFLYQITLFKYLYRLFSETIFKKFILILFLWVVVLNFKGLAELNPYIILFMVVKGYELIKKDKTTYVSRFSR